tara:strand:- start:35 stop:727 length:693 start_codon:yes stop_codon:yes gene_type:complete
MKRLCIVPARGGSKRFPNKNVALLNDKPLIYHTLDVAVETFDRVVFTSDSDEILGVAQKHSSNIEVFKRPVHLATDTSKVIDTVNFYFNKYKNEIDQIWLCLPTCPLRTAEDIRSAQALLTKDVDGVLSITEYGFPPALGLDKNNDNVLSDWHSSQPWQNNNSRSQDHPTVYRPNGAVYGMWRESFEKNKNFYLGKIKGHFMSREKSIDIDTALDFKIAQTLLSEENNGL